MATQCRSSKCTAERKGFRRELDSWRHKLIHCVGFESILEGIYGPRLLQDLNIFDDCEPETVDDWSMDAGCSFCNLPIEKINDNSPTVASPPSPPAAETPPPQVLPTSEKLQCQANRFLHAVFHKKEFPPGCDHIIPLAAQELMHKMIRQFALEYACKSQMSEGQNSVTANPDSACLQNQADPDGPLDLTVSRSSSGPEQADGVLDLSKKNFEKVPAHQRVSGRLLRKDCVVRSSDFAEGLLSKALKDIRSGLLDIHKAAILYGIPQKTLRLQTEALSPKGWAAELKNSARQNGSGSDGFSQVTDARLVLQKVATWAQSQSERPELGKLLIPSGENLEFSSFLHNLTLQRLVSQHRDKNEALLSSEPSTTPPPQSPASPAVHIRIPQVRPSTTSKTTVDLAGLVDTVYQATKTSIGVGGATQLQKLKTILPKQGASDCPAPRLLQADLPPLCLNLKHGSASGSPDDCGDEADRRDKQPRKKRGRYRQYDHDILEEAIGMVMNGKMSVSKAQGIYGVPHSTLEYKVKERLGTLKTPPKKKPRQSEGTMTGAGNSGTTTNASTTAFKSSLVPTSDEQCQSGEEKVEPSEVHRQTALEMVLSSLCPYHRNLLYHILKYVREDHSVSVALRDAHRRLPKPDPRCCQTGRKPSENSSVSLGDCTVVRTCCLQTCSLATCAVAPVCVCLKNLHGLACQNVAIGCVGKVICSASAMCYAHRILPCAHQSNGEHAYIAHVRSVESIPVTSRYVSDSHDACRGCRSPSPPPLSPMPLDIESKTSEKNNSCHSQDCKAQSTQPPPLLPHQAEGDDTVLCTDTLNHESPPAEEPEQQKGSLITIAQVSDRSFIDLMDRFTEKLKTIKPPEKEQILSSLASQNSKSSDDTHLREIITTVLHSGKDSNDYNLNELFNRHEANAHRSPQTRSRRRQEVRAAMAKSPDLPASRRQNLQIKMELARLDPSLSRRKSGTERNKCPKNVRHSPPFSPSSSEPLNCPNLDRLSKGVDKEIKKDPTNNQASTTHSNLLVKNAPAIQCNINEQKPPTYLSEPQDPSLLDENKEMPPDYKIVESPKPDENRELLPPYEERELVAPETKELAPLSTLGEAALQLEGVRHRKSKMKPWRYAEGSAFRGSGDIGRSRRNIVPPQRFSSYVTEPRKMYFAACFSESIFIKRSPKSNTSNKVYATETNKTSSTADVSEETTKTKVESSIQDCDLPCVTICRSQPTDESDHLSKEKGLCEGAVSVKTVLPKRSPRTKHRKDPMSPAKTLKPFGTQNSDTKLEKSVSGSVTSDSAGDSTESHSGLLYTSPIKLMFVSPVRSEEGVKYTLKSAVSGPNSDGQMFDPCVVASWGDNVEPSTSTQNTELAFQSPKKGEGGKDKNTSPKPSPTDTTKTPGHSNTVGEDQEPLLVTREPTPVKRRPGRPKKLGPQMEKPAKRPIGRPPKLKTADSNSLNSKSGSQEVNQRASETSCDDANKNLKITIVYGRSRRARRLVSEDLDLPMDQHMCEILNGAQYSENHSGKNMGGKCSNRNSLVGATKDQMEDLNFVRPVKDQKGTVHSSSNIKCQKQSDLAVTRKPGRPPKVKISGISVTVTTVSPRQRKIHMKRDAKDSPPRPRALLPEFDSPSKDQRTISASPNGICKDGTCTGEDKGDNPKSLLKPVRQSLRERKPSIYLLHSIATARSFSHSNALVRKSRKLLLNKANSETSRLRQQGKPEEAATRALSTKTKNVNCSQDLSRLSGISVDSIFQSNEALKWWPTSASTETLNEELARRIRLMSDTWVSDALEVSKSCMEEMESLKQKPCQRINGSAKRSGSAVKMLFESHFNMEKLCSWFMQTTETQSLAIVKKASTRNPPEVFHYNPSRATSRTDFCPSPQAERLRKHVKKFAKVVPKSPTMHRRAQETMCNKSRLGAKRKLFQKSSPLKRKRGFQQSLPGPRGTWTMYRSSLLRARSKFKSRKERTKTELQNHSDPLSKLPLGIQQHKEPSLVEKQPAFGGTVSVPKGMVQNTFNSSDCNKTAIKPHKPMVEKTDISKEERICSKAWSPETLKECRVFLKKINSPDTESTAEECNICTVKLYDVSPSGYSVTVQKVEEEEEEAAAVVPGKTRSSPRKLASSLRCQNKDGRKKDKRKSTSTCGTPPAKMARQSRSSRGMVGARWCDFVLGTAK